MAWVIDQELVQVRNRATGALESAAEALSAAQTDTAGLASTTMFELAGTLNGDAAVSRAQAAASMLQSALASLHAASGAARDMDVMVWVPDDDE